MNKTVERENFERERPIQLSSTEPFPTQPAPTRESYAGTKDLTSSATSYRARVAPRYICTPLPFSLSDYFPVICYGRVPNRPFFHNATPVRSDGPLGNIPNYVRAKGSACVPCAARQISPGRRKVRPDVISFSRSLFFFIVFLLSFPFFFIALPPLS